MKSASAYTLKSLCTVEKTMLEEDFASIAEKSTAGYARTCRAPVYVGF